MSDEAEGSVETGNPEVGVTQDWTAGLDEYSDTIEAKGWSGTADVLKSYVNLERQVGADKVVLPAEGSELSEWEGWSKLGTPETADEYQLASPEGFEAYSEDLSNWFRNAAFEMKLPKTMAQGLHDRFIENFISQNQMAENERIDKRKSWENELHQEYGSAFDQRVEAGKRALREYGSPEVHRILEETGLGSNPDFVRMFVKMGMSLGSGPQFKEGQTQGQFGTTPDQALEQMAAIRNHPGYFDPSHAEHKALKAKMNRLSELAYGEEDATANISVG